MLTSGRKKSSARRERPIAKPIATPKIAASANPASRRKSVRGRGAENSRHRQANEGKRRLPRGREQPRGETRRDRALPREPRHQEWEGGAGDDRQAEPPAGAPRLRQHTADRAAPARTCPTIGGATGTGKARSYLRRPARNDGEAKSAARSRHGSKPSAWPRSGGIRNRLSVPLPTSSAWRKLGSRMLLSTKASTSAPDRAPPCASDSRRCRSRS